MAHIGAHHLDIRARKYLKKICNFLQKIDATTAFSPLESMLSAFNKSTKKSAKGATMPSTLMTGNHCP